MQKNTTNVSLVPKLAIKLNEQIGELCPLCSNPTNANIGAEIVEDSTNAVVCRSCAYQHAPQLLALLNLAESARFFINTENDFGKQLEETHFPQIVGLKWNEFREVENV